jgi:hypothetical protein
MLFGCHVILEEFGLPAILLMGGIVLCAPTILLLLFWVVRWVNKHGMHSLHTVMPAVT